MLSTTEAPAIPSCIVPPDNPTPRWKRGLDLLGCAVALPLVLAVAGGVMLWIKLVSPGPIFFKQERVGLRGRCFLLYKFRTMRVDADGASHRAHFSDLVRAQRPMQKLDATRDVRLIPGGWLLRASGADELPQLLNVLRGEMSLVGPRPCIPYEYEHYTDWHRLRLNSVPGLTGLWQVSGKNRTTFDEMVRLDIHYGQTKSLGRDLLIALKTLPALWVQIADTRRLRRPPAAAGSPPAHLPPGAPECGGDLHAPVHSSSRS
jgi:lipopolysaccharide/colanic/teichoic acid biosynthesis glycosyltransferase